MNGFGIWYKGCSLLMPDLVPEAALLVPKVLQGFSWAFWLVSNISPAYRSSNPVQAGAGRGLAEHCFSTL